MSKTETEEADSAVDDILNRMRNPEEMEEQLQQLMFFIKALVYRIGRAQGKVVHIRNSDLQKSAPCVLNVTEDPDSQGINMVLTEPAQPASWPEIVADAVNGESRG